MNTVLIIMFICLIIGAVIAFRQFEGVNLLWVIPIFSFIGALIGLFAGVFLGLFLSLFFPKHEVKDRHDIIAMKDVSSIYGSMFLGSGTIKERNYYFYYEKNNSGAISQHRVAADITLVYEDTEDSIGYVELHRYDLNYPYSEWAIQNGCGCDKPRFNHAEVHIPKGSVIRQFKLDLQ